MQHLPFGYRFGNVFGEDMQNDVGHCLGWGGRQGLFLHAHAADAHAGFSEIDGGQADEQSECGHDFEVNQRLDAHAAYLLEVGVAGNAHHQRGKYQRRDDGFHEPQEGIAEHLQAHGDAGRIVAQLDANEHAHHNPEREGAAGSRSSSDSGQCQPAGGDWHGRR